MPLVPLVRLVRFVPRVAVAVLRPRGGAGESPRSTSRPDRSGGAAVDSALTQTKNLLRATSPSSVRPFLTSPSRICGAREGGTAQAT